jgi:hypothetical protein
MVSLSQSRSKKITNIQNLTYKYLRRGIMWSPISVKTSHNLLVLFNTPISLLHPRRGLALTNLSCLPFLVCFLPLPGFALRLSPPLLDQNQNFICHP